MPDETFCRNKFCTREHFTREVVSSEHSITMLTHRIELTAYWMSGIAPGNEGPHTCGVNACLAPQHSGLWACQAGAAGFAAAGYQMQRPVAQLVCIVGVRAGRQEQRHELDTLVCVCTYTLLDMAETQHAVTYSIVGM